MRVAPVLLLALALAGCQTVNSREAAEQRMLSYQGLGERQLVEQLGPPDNVYVGGGKRYLTWYSAKTQVRPPYTYSMRGPERPWWVLPHEVDDRRITRTCKTTLILERGKVTGWNLQGDGC
jgi:hypothetical protein